MEIYKNLALDIYRLTFNFPKHETYGLTSQIRRDSRTEHFYLRTVHKFTVVVPPEDYGYTGRFKSNYTFGAGMELLYEYHWGGG